MWIVVNDGMMALLNMMSSKPTTDICDGTLMPVACNARSTPIAVRSFAVMTANDLTAIGVLRALHATGISVPSQMSVVGFDDIMLSSAIIPSLTTIHISKEEMAQACIKALDHTKANVNKRGLLLSISGSLVIRESTAPPTAQTAASAIDNSMWHMRPAASMRETKRGPMPEAIRCS